MARCLLAGACRDVIGTYVTGIETTRSTGSTAHTASVAFLIAADPSCCSSSSSFSSRPATATHQLTATVECGHTPSRLFSACSDVGGDVGRHGLACHSSAVDPAVGLQRPAQQCILIARNDTLHINSCQLALGMLMTTCNVKLQFIDVNNNNLECV